eukprot:CAMPEP_0198567856 /NCGR_PEP_ID=MMETSP1462-20131121/105463_1 /TAXON_ID=1333877 /ORGANISM="Brandtodinium nutriculum, Strain RCC3387" /LENGTH=144 /DNA_ID=CAMNT_0044298911 /DNA_START=56 /DNA_END=490 /DNA_ORIENTATION=+
MTHDLHDLVLALPGVHGIRDDYCDPAQYWEPHIVLGPSPQPSAQTSHELGARRHRIPVEGHARALHGLGHRSRLLRSAEAARALLVQLRAGGHAVQGNIEQQPRVRQRHEGSQLRLDQAEQHVLILLPAPLLEAAVHHAVEIQV